MLGSEQPRPTRSVTTVEVPRGLAGVIVTDTQVGDVRGEEGFYHYRQYNAVELAEKRTLEDVWVLMIDGYLPDAGQRARVRRRDHAAAARPGAGQGPAAGHRRGGARRADERPAGGPAAAGRPARHAAAVRHRRADPPRRRAVRQRPGPDGPDRDPPARQGPGDGGAPRRPVVRGELPLHAHRHRAHRRAGPRDRAVPDLDRGPRLQQLHVHRPRHRLHRRRPGRGRHRRAGLAVRPAARRRPLPGPGHPRRDRHPRQGRGLGPRTGGGGRPHHGLRPSGLPHRRSRARSCSAASPSASAATWWTSPCRSRSTCSRPSRS